MIHFKRWKERKVKGAKRKLSVKGKKEDQDFIETETNVSIFMKRKDNKWNLETKNITESSP